MDRRNFFGLVFGGLLGLVGLSLPVCASAKVRSHPKPPKGWYLSCWYLGTVGSFVDSDGTSRLRWRTSLVYERTNKEMPPDEAERTRRFRKDCQTPDLFGFCVDGKQMTLLVTSFDCDLLAGRMEIKGFYE